MNTKTTHYTTQELADKIGVCTTAILRRAKKGKLGEYKRGQGYDLTDEQVKNLTSGVGKADK